MAAASAAAVGVGVLIVEDDPFVHEPLRRVLQRWGHQVRLAETVDDGLKALDPLPACVILDLMLPDGYGTGVLRHIRERDLPVNVAVVTGTGDQDLLEETRRLQPDKLYHKPVNLLQLKEWLEGCR